MGIQYNQTNDVATTLNGAITSGATSITVTSGSNFPAVPFVVRIDSELLLVTSTGTGTNWTVTRASETVNGSATAASHNDGAIVRQVTTAAAWNALVQLQTGAATAQTGTASLTQATNTATLTVTNTGNNPAGYAIQASTSSTNTGPSAIYGSNTGNGDGIQGIALANTAYGVKGVLNASTDGAGAGGRFDGGTHANGLQVVNNHATKETLNATNSGAGSAAIFANNGGNATVTATNSGAGIGFTGSTADSGSAGVKGQNTGTGYGLEGYSSSGIAGYFHTGTDQPQVKAQAVASQTNPIYGAYDSGGNLIGGLYYSAQGSLSIAYASPNYIMNGDMLVNQRFGPGGTLSITTGAQKQYMVDRWFLDKDGTSQGTLSQQAFTLGQTDVPNEPIYYLDWNITTAGSGATKNNLQHNIESVRTLAGKQVTLSFYGKVATSTQSVTPEIEQNFGSGGSPSAAVVNTGSAATFTTTFQRFTYTVTLGSISGKTLGTTAFTDSLIIRFKCPLNTACRISISHVQLELGPLATPYRVQTFEQAFIDCGRYYQKSYPYATVAANNNNTGQILSSAPAAVGGTHFVTCFLPGGAMRIPPTVTFFNPSSTTAGQVHDYSTGTASTAVAKDTNVIPGGFFQANITPPAGWAAGNLLGFGWTADSDY